MECWSCGAETKRATFCPTCGKIQPIGGATLFEVLGLPRAMKLDKDAIESAFRDVSRKVHPDRFGQASAIERKLALEHTTKVNEAYRTLRDPQRRAEYLLRLEGVDVAGEETRTKDPALLMEMLELQERVEQENAPGALEALAREVRARVDEALAAAGAYFDERRGTREQSAATLGELRYLKRLLERIDMKLDEVS